MIFLMKVCYYKNYETNYWYYKYLRWEIYKSIFIDKVFNKIRVFQDWSPYGYRDDMEVSRPWYINSKASLCSFFAKANITNNWNPIQKQYLQVFTFN